MGINALSGVSHFLGCVGLTILIILLRQVGKVFGPKLGVSVFFLTVLVLFLEFSDFPVVAISFHN